MHIKLNKYPSYPHTSGKMGAMANDSPRCRIFYCCCCCIHVCLLLLLLLLLLLYACVFWGVLLLLHACVFVMWLCIVGFVCVVCEFLLLPTIIFGEVVPTVSWSHSTTHCTFAHISLSNDIQTKCLL